MGVAKRVDSAGLNESGEAWKSVDQWEASKAYRDLSTVVLTPLRANGLMHIKVVRGWMSMQWPMNQNHANIDLTGMEVGAAYQELIENALDHPIMKDWQFVATWEDDNLLPADGMLRLYKAIHTCVDCGGSVSGEEWTCPEGHKGLDGVSGLYFAKMVPPIPMAFGDPTSPELEFRPRSVKREIAEGTLFEVNGIANGFSLYRMEVFRKLSSPWFATKNGEDGEAATQDLYFCRKAKEELGSRFAIDASCKVGHLDTKTGRIY